MLQRRRASDYVEDVISASWWGDLQHGKVYRETVRSGRNGTRVINRMIEGEVLSYKPTKHWITAVHNISATKRFSYFIQKLRMIRKSDNKKDYE